MTVRRRATSRRDTLDGCFEQELVKVYMLDEYENFKLLSSLMPRIRVLYWRVLDTFFQSDISNYFR